MSDKKKEPESSILHIAVFKACPLAEEIKSLRITADQCRDDLPQEAQETWSGDLLMQKDAEKIFNAIKQTLPRGTIERLLVVMLKDRCSQIEAKM